MKKLKKLLVALGAVLIISIPAHASPLTLFFSNEDPQHMLNKQYKAYAVARTFTPGTIRRYRSRLVDTSRPLPKSIRLFIDTNIDWVIYARSIFGSNWDKLTAGQRRNFKSLLRKVHIKKYGKYFSPDTKFSARFNKPTGYKFFKGHELAKVPIIFVSHRRNVKFDIDFVFYKGAKRWALCDVYIDGVSHSKTYRSQVKRIYEKRGYDGVMKAFRRALDKS